MFLVFVKLCLCLVFLLLVDYQMIESCINKCKNGICVIGLDNEPYCNCINGYYGNNCQEHPCDKNPCKNGGKCIPESIDARYSPSTLLRMKKMPSLMYQLMSSKYEKDIVLGYRCDCPKRYPGEHCERRVICAGNDAEALSDTDLVTCSNVGKCTNSGGSVSCQCDPGHEGSRCRIYTECKPNPCANGFACLPLYGTAAKFTEKFSCACQGKDKYCKQYDFDECSAGTKCHPDATCHNTAGSFFCKCNNGYTGDGQTCYAINNCTLQSVACDREAECVKSGNSLGCQCKPDFSGNGRSCIFRQDCSRTKCTILNPVCSVKNGKETCRCEAGYRVNAYKCIDANECQSRTHNCHKHASCTNTIGSYTCRCRSGWIGNGVSCTDIDECKAKTFRCHHNANCVNVDGSYKCQCDRGYSGSGFYCIDIDECNIGSAKCPPRSACVNLRGSFQCICKKGYGRQGSTCVDINECARSIDNCNKNADCLNTVGSFKCECRKGFEGTGTVCTDKNECGDGSHTCHEHGVCRNIAGTYTCTCKPGYKGDGFYCEDVNECTEGTHNCDKTGAICINLDGKFTCRKNDDRDFAIRFNPLTRVQDTPIIYNVKNKQTRNIGMCAWYKLSQYPEPFERSLFQYVIEQRAEGFQVLLHSRPTEQLEIHFGGEHSLFVPFPVRTYQWTHLCLLWKSGQFTVWRNGKVLNNGKRYNTYFLRNGLFPISNTGKLILGQDSHDQMVPYGVNNPYRAFQGFITHFMLWQRPLDENDIKNAYNKQPPADGVIVDWKQWKAKARGRTVRVVRLTNTDPPKECFGIAHDCHQNAMCVTTRDSYLCVCKDGYIGNGRSCEDENECKIKSHQCSLNAVCENQPGSYSCKCKEGYRGNGLTCEDINECQGISQSCHENARCVNNIGSFSCYCKNGYVGNGQICDDKNECLDQSDRCHTNASCINVLGSYKCTCKQGQSGDGLTCKEEVDPCKKMKCSRFATCAKKSDSYSCTCNTGFTGNGLKCVDINECRFRNNCSRNARCINNAGSYSCKCKRGFSGDGYQCIDVNECNQAKHACDKKNAKCVNLIGSYSCKCNKGFSGNGYSCADVNECRLGSNRCDSIKSTCVNTIGSYSCKCKLGYSGNGYYCIDVNECTESVNSCHSNAKCMNTIGSFRCQCKNGYRGNGNSCLDVNECVEGRDTCDANSICRNSPGAYTCVCKEGYEESDQSCSDVDECERKTDNCRRLNKRCVNIEGSYTCQEDKDMRYSVYFNKRTRTRDTPVLFKVKNKKTSGVSMCTWYKLSQSPSPFSRSLFQYVIEQCIKGFQVWLHAFPFQKLEIQFGGRYSIFINGYDTKDLSWTHLCIIWNKGLFTIWRNGQQFDADKRHYSYFLFKTFFPANSNGKLLLGQDTDDQSVPYGIVDEYRAFQGWITHFMLYERTLNETDIQASYNRKPPLDDVIVSWHQWKSSVRGRTINVVRLQEHQFPKQIN